MRIFAICDTSGTALPIAHALMPKQMPKSRYELCAGTVRKLWKAAPRVACVYSYLSAMPDGSDALQWGEPVVAFCLGRFSKDGARSENPEDPWVWVLLGSPAWERFALLEGLLTEVQP